MRKKILYILAAVFVLFFGALFLTAIWRARDCGRMGVCISNLKQIGLAMRMYATDYDGNYPPQLAFLYPGYVSNLSAFLCPSKAYVAHLTEKDVLRDFTVCYEYTPGLTDKSNPDSILAIERKGNHLIGHHKGGRGAVFVAGHVKTIFPPGAFGRKR